MVPTCKNSFQLTSHNSRILVSDGLQYSKSGGSAIDESQEVSATVVGNVHSQLAPIGVYI